MKMDPKIRFLLDNLRDGLPENTLVAWPAYDVHESREVWLVGRRVKEKVMPLAVLLPDSAETLKRYAPALAEGEYDFSQCDLTGR